MFGRSLKLYLVYTENSLFVLDEEKFRSELVKYREMVKNAGLVVGQCHGPWRYPPRDATEEERSERFSAMTKALRGAAYLGAPIFVIHPIMPCGANSSENPEMVLKINREYYTRLADVAQRLGIVIGFENMPFPDFPLASVRAITDFVRELNHPNFKVCLDTGHAIVTGEDLGEAVRYIGKDLLVALHIHDNDGEGDKHWLPGQGIGNFGGFANALREIGFDGIMSIETGVDIRLADDEWEEKSIQLANYIRSLCLRQNNSARAWPRQQ